MYEALKHSHSGLRWILLIALIAVVVQLLSRSHKSGSKLPAITTGLFHLQTLLGIILYFALSPMTKNLSFNMKDAVQRFYGVEHVFGMLVALVLVTLASRIYKRGRSRRAGWLYFFALLLVLLSIPWPFRIPSAGWF